MRYNYNIFSDVYGAGNFGSNAFSDASSTNTSTTTGSSGSALNSDALVNTGFDLILGATIGSLIIFSAIVIRLWRKPRKTADPQHSHS